MNIVSTMNRSMGSSFLRMVSTASVTMDVSWSAIDWISFVRREVLATIVSSSLSGSSCDTFTSFLNFSRSSSTAVFANSNPSTTIRGWTPSPSTRSACFMSSPIKSTIVVVPSLVLRSVSGRVVGAVVGGACRRALNF